MVQGIFLKVVYGSHTPEVYTHRLKVLYGRGIYLKVLYLHTG